MSRAKIIEANRIVEFVRNRGHDLQRAGKNFVTDGCPVCKHQKRGHRPVTLYTETQSWNCHDCKRGGSVIDWVMSEQNVTAADAMRMLSAERNSSDLRSNDNTERPPRRLLAKTYDYTDESGKMLFQCVRFRPKYFSQRRPDGNGGWIWNLEGVRRVLYRFPELREGLKRGLPVIVCEGEKDVDALRELDLPMAVTCNPMGAGKWSDEYSETLRGATAVYVIADKDEPDERGHLKGEEHAQQVATSLQGKSKSVAVLELPDRNGRKVKDPSDWLAAGGNTDELIELLHAARERTPQSKSMSATQTERPRIAKLTLPPQPLTFEQWRDVIKANFPTLVRPAEICLSIEAQLLNDVCNPFALALVDVPASGKTITLNFFDGLAELTYTTDNFTPASFVSHASNVKREELGSVDLLPRIRYRTLIVRELGSVFGAKDDDLIKSLGILTRVLDGEGLETDSGVHGRRGYKGDYLFMLLAGTPPIPPRVFKIMGNFGSRLFFLSLHTPDEDDDYLIAQNKGTAHKLKETNCQQATETFLRTLWAANPTGVEWNKADDPDDCLRVIARCARLLAALRDAINVWQSDHPDEGGKKLLHNIPVIEKPHRINCLLYNLARAHSLFAGDANSRVRICGRFWM